MWHAPNRTAASPSAPVPRPGANGRRGRLRGLGASGACHEGESDPNNEPLVAGTGYSGKNPVLAGDYFGEGSDIRARGEDGCCGVGLEGHCSTATKVCAVCILLPPVLLMDAVENQLSAKL